IVAVVPKSKRILERYKNDPKRKSFNMTQPSVVGGGGKADEWEWTEIRPWLEETFGKKLPERFPTDRVS
ncbi:MAG: hypothetical protein KDA84_16070, partial [Planctomycetaceae bacterium]|nr:hypothetical protein [Planctomycetaceae bacterium]